MITATSNYYPVVSQLPEGAVVIFQGVTWKEYEELLDQVGEASGLRISYNDGTLKVMSISVEHETCVRFIEALIGAIRIALRIDIRFTGSATMRKRRKKKGNEPDASFYVQTASEIGNRLDLDFEVDSPPDIAVEVDIHHDSMDKDSIYAALGVPEIWRYDGWTASIRRLQGNNYVEAETSLALPMITPAILTEYLTRLREEGEFAAIIAFDRWLQTLQK
ncbi:MAG TPA: Uma2 family endonuclease [Blastocatellia bacterium]|nr:Uma2 family endonuclease [Blastocatellia bacterium]